MAVLAQHPNIVGCKLSHGDVSHLAQIALHPSIDHAKFRVYTGLGQQLLPVVSVGCDGAIDGLAGFFPKSVVRLFELSSKAQPSAHELEERRQLQYLVSAAEELVVQFGIPGIKEAISRLRGFGDVDGTRPPLKRGMPEGQWGKWKHAIDALEKTEASL
jgi:2-keto-3-deoxy-L-rhamnonate aldolase